jgi:hypothetical protein
MGTEFQAETVMEAILGAKQNGVCLHAALIGCTSTYLLGFIAQEDEAAMRAELPMSPPEWMDTFSEAWQAVSAKLMPSAVQTRAQCWAGGSPGDDPRTTSHAAPGEAGGGDPGSSGGPKAMPFYKNPGKPGAPDEYIAEMMSGLVVSDHDVPKAIDDIMLQRISGVRCVALSLALMSGHVHPAGESAELRFGSDLRLCQLIRQQRKAGVHSLDDIVKGKNKRELSLHYTRLAKEFNDRGMIEEATLVSQFWAESSATFEGDDAGLFVYIAEWNRSYAGRGIPKILDTDLILRHRKSESGGASSAELKKVEDAVKATEKELRKSEERNSLLMKRLQKLEAKASGSSGDKVGDKACFICGGNHLARNCPEKKGGKGKDKDTPIVLEESD